LAAADKRMMRDRAMPQRMFAYVAALL